MRLSIRDIQRLLTAAGYYNGGLDGDAGPKTHRAVEALLGAHSGDIPARMSDKRRLVAAAQLILAHAGFEPGQVDGYAGHNTIEAYNAWAYEQDHGKREDLGRDESLFDDAGRFTKSSSVWPRQRDVERFYGPVGTNQAKIDLPYDMLLAWNTRRKVNTMTCHEKVADAMQGIFRRVYDAYGLDQIKKLRLHYYGGCLNVRKMRGGTAWSMHSWGIAVDLDPANNRLRWGRDRATFARPEYKEFWRIVENAGAISLGRVKNFDWMHYQFARL